MADLWNLPPDMFAEIMSRVPAASLLELKRVSRLWHALIRELVDDPAFVSAHLTNMKKRDSTSAVFVHQFNGQTEPGQERHSLVTIFHSDRFAGQTYYASITEGIDLNAAFGGRGRWQNTFHCDGIVCVFRDLHTFCIINPILCERRIVPTPSREVLQGIGFGYDARAKDYKLVRIFHPLLGKQPDVYSLNDDSWNAVSMPENMQALWIFNYKGIYAKGVYYWSARGDRNVFESILCFNMSDEEFYLLNLPEIDTSQLLPAKINFTVWNNSFTAICCYGYSRSDVLSKCTDIYTVDNHCVKEKRASAWTRQRFAGQPANLSKSLWCLGNNELVTVADDKRLFAYNLHSQKFRVIAVQDSNKFEQGVYLYIESLVSVKKRRSDEKNDFGDEQVEKPFKIGDLSQMSLTGSGER